MKKITILAGHYGSGKTNLAVNYALFLKQSHERVIVCDVDTVNPYFRTKDQADVFDKAGISLIAPEFANSNLDIPSISPKVNIAFDGKDIYSVFDVGGDDAGALAMGQFAKKVQDMDYDMFLVINKYRFMTGKPEDLLTYLREIENASHIAFTGIINNSNMGAETTKELVLDSFAYAEEVARLTHLPMMYHAVSENVYEKEAFAAYNNIFKVKIYKKTIWDI